MWILPTLHRNYYNFENQLRMVFGQTLIKYAAQIENNLALQLKQVLDEEESNLYLFDQQRFTSDGLSAFFRAVDQTIRYADTIINKNITTRKPGRDIERKRERPEDRYQQNAPGAKRYLARKPKFLNKKFKKVKKEAGERRRLPTPPPF